MATQETTPRRVEETLLRVVVGWRLFSLLWMAGLVVEVLLNDDDANETIVVAAAALVVAWTALTVAIARDRKRFVSWGWVIADGAVVTAVGLAPLAADASSFYGGFLLSWVIYIAYVFKERWLFAGVISATLMSITQVLDEVYREGSFNVVGDVAVFYATAWVMGAGMWALRRNEALLFAARDQLADERSRRGRADERAELAARLHDSVLQTLPVMRQRAQDSDTVRRLARLVERQLRQFLERLNSEYSDGLRAAISDAAWEVEDLYEISVSTVGAGDCRMDEGTGALVAATREALINSAKYAGVEEIALFSEVRDGTARVFVRDRGAGFDLERTDSGGRGIAESIVGRMQRSGGTAVIRSTPGEGTEVELSIPLKSL